MDEMLKEHYEREREIAAQCGFPDPNYLAKVMRKRLGHSPSELRLAGR